MESNRNYNTSVIWDNKKEKYKKMMNTYVTSKLQDENAMKLNNFRSRYECYADTLKKGLQREMAHKQKVEKLIEEHIVKLQPPLPAPPQK